MERSAFLNSVGGDRRYKAEVFAEYFASFIGNGIFPNPSTNLQIMANDDMTITVRPGKAWINGYFYENLDDLILVLDPADGVLNRIDRLVLRYDVVGREIRVKIKKGQFKGEPEPTELQRDDDAYELGLADINVSQGAISITQADITDLRLNKGLCGIVHGTVDQVDTTTIFNQFQSWYTKKTQSFENNWESWYAEKTQRYMKDWDNWFYPKTANWEASFIEWFNAIKGSLEEDPAAFLTNEVMEIKSTLTEVDSVEIAEIEHGLNRYPGSLLIHNEYAAGVGGAGVGPAGGNDGWSVNHKTVYPSLDAVRIHVPTIYKDLELKEVTQVKEGLYYLIFNDTPISMTLILQ